MYLAILEKFLNSVKPDLVLIHKIVSVSSGPHTCLEISFFSLPLFFFLFTSPFPRWWVALTESCWMLPAVAPGSSPRTLP